MESKKIFAAALESERPARAYGTWDGSMLVVTHVLPLGGDWRGELAEECRRRSGEGFVVLVEDRTGSFSGHAAPFSFDAVEPDGGTTFQRAVEWALSLRSGGALVVPRELERYLLRTGEGGNLDVAHDDRGRVVYRPDWTRLTGGHKAMLMCVYGAVLEPPLSDRWLSRYIAAAGARAERRDAWPATPDAIGRAFSVGVQERLEAGRAACDEEEG